MRRTGGIKPNKRRAETRAVARGEPTPEHKTGKPREPDGRGPCQGRRKQQGLPTAGSGPPGPARTASSGGLEHFRTSHGHGHRLMSVSSKLDSRPADSGIHIPNLRVTRSQVKTDGKGGTKGATERVMKMQGEDMKVLTRTEPRVSQAGGGTTPRGGKHTSSTGSSRRVSPREPSPLGPAVPLPLTEHGKGRLYRA